MNFYLYDVNQTTRVPTGSPLASTSTPGYTTTGDKTLLVYFSYDSLTANHHYAIVSAATCANISQLAVRRLTAGTLTTSTVSYDSGSSWVATTTDWGIGVLGTHPYDAGFAAPMDTTLNALKKSFLGVAAEDVSGGSTGTVYMFGIFNDVYTGLATGSLYKFGENGSKSVGSGAEATFFGQAISENMFYLKAPLYQ
jgi:hypothetical protein